MGEEKKEEEYCKVEVRWRKPEFIQQWKLRALTSSLKMRNFCRSCTQ
jgi:hypothetical protein